MENQQIILLKNQHQQIGQLKLIHKPPKHLNNKHIKQLLIRDKSGENNQSSYRNTQFYVEQNNKERAHTSDLRNPYFSNLAKQGMQKISGTTNFSNFSQSKSSSLLKQNLSQGIVSVQNEQENEKLQTQYSQQKNIGSTQNSPEQNRNQSEVNLFQEAKYALNQEINKGNQSKQQSRNDANCQAFNLNSEHQNILAKISQDQEIFRKRLQLKIEILRQGKEQKRIFINNSLSGSCSNIQRDNSEMRILPLFNFNKETFQVPFLEKPTSPDSFSF
ncbi:UNKNOWN [Stylonychia lemnae]|uniref:Uncharacterized protein n=1 Tax=Stylonychia lemnae TaxID=5949 RepID=A0A078BCC0_STYLE|nr:UNKNOWN [Stylonychia lemnae]|eukprot:CDW91846.1 UNKNOWN [Stylonychia lemnae]